MPSRLRVTTKALLVGGGGREHAIAEALLRSGAEVYAVMGNRNPGIHREARDTWIHDVNDGAGIAAWARDCGADLAVIGPEGPLDRGVADALNSAGIPTVGPGRKEARLETSKEFTRNLMRDHRIPGLVRYRAFDRLEDFEVWLRTADHEFVLKPVGLAGGKGVQVWGDHFTTKPEALERARTIVERGIGGSSRFLVEDKVVGEEFSVQALCDGTHLLPMPLAQDHKRAFEGDRGPNTGGMGSYTDADHRLPFLKPSDVDAALETMRRTVDAMKSRGTPFRGVLYGGFMAVRDGVRLLEYNVRFADPECMNVLPILEDDFVELCFHLTEGTLPESARFERRATVCKYVVPEGYGGKPRAGEVLEVDEGAVAATGAKLFYAAVDSENGRVRTTTSRSLALVGVAGTIPEAHGQVESALRCVRGRYAVRHDIGSAELLSQRVEHMRQLRASESG